MMSTQPDQNPLLENFYAKPFDFSYSGLNKLLFSPGLFYTHYVLRDREDSTDTYLVNGKVVHALVLEDGTFDDNFIVSPAKLPGGEGRVLVDNIYKIYETYRVKSNLDGLKSELKDFESELLSKMKDMNYYQSINADKVRLEKVLTDGNINYFEFLKKKAGKTLLDQETLDLCMKSSNALKNHKRASELLKLNHKSTNMLKIFNEKMLSTRLPGYPFGLRGILDNFVVDYQKREIHVNDLKVTGKTLSDFKDSLEYFMYWAQAAIYMRLIEQWINDESDITSAEGWQVFFHFIVIDKYLQIYPFPVSAETLNSWQARLEEKLERARYHYESRDYSLPYEFAKGQVEL